MNIVYLYSELAPYNIPVIKVLVQKYNANIYIISWDKNKLKPYNSPMIKNVHYYKRSNFDSKKIIKFIDKISPDIIYVSGWMDKGYFPALKRFKLKGIPIVTGFDDQWIGSLRQIIGSFIFKIYLNKYFTHAWIAGVRQFEFAKKLGFENDKIIFDMLSCNLDLFKNISLKTKENFPKTFLYVGNFRKVKGIDILINAFKRYRDNYNGKWTLTCVGNGELKYLLKNEKNVKVLDFKKQNELAKIASLHGVFILPSRHDQWGVVVHEFSLAGMPLLLSTNVGAKDTFLIEYLNGLSFKSGEEDELVKRMLEFSNFPNTKLVEMGIKSRELAYRITPETSASNLMSVTGKK